MHNIYVNGEDRCPKTLYFALNVLVNCKWGRRPPAQQYESREGVAITTKGNPGGFRGDCYNCGESGHMARYYPEPMKEESRKSNQSGK